VAWSDLIGIGLPAPSPPQNQAAKNQGNAERYRKHPPYKRDRQMWPLGGNRLRVDDHGGVGIERTREWIDRAESRRAPRPMARKPKPSIIAFTWVTQADTGTVV
jgi:hypothetical protein